MPFSIVNLFNAFLTHLLFALTVASSITPVILIAQRKSSRSMERRRSSFMRNRISSWVTKSPMVSLRLIYLISCRDHVSRPRLSLPVRARQDPLFVWFCKVSWLFELDFIIVVVHHRIRHDICIQFIPCSRLSTTDNYFFLLLCLFFMFPFGIYLVSCAETNIKQHHLTLMPTIVYSRLRDDPKQRTTWWQWFKALWCSLWSVKWFREPVIPLGPWRTVYGFKPIPKE